MLKEITLGDGKLKVIREGTIYTPLGNVRGINPVASEKTLVKYVCSEEIPEIGKKDTEFVFHGELPEEIEGKNFAFTEVYATKDKSQIPLEQYLYVFGQYLNFETFKFPEK